MSTNANTENKIVMLSQSRSVNMADDWFDIATPDHFWITRRFTVVKSLLRGIDLAEKRVVEIGCGNGLVQRQMEDHYGIATDGFDLNLGALRRSVVRRSNLFYYDITELRPEFQEAYDLVILFDVLEHIEGEIEFLEAVSFCLKRGGFLLINVPALQTLYSAYDREAGHLRRYTISSLRRVLERAGMRTVKESYWGWPLIPLLFVRLFYLRGVNADAVIEQGFGTRNRHLNNLLKLWSNLEYIPNKLLGTSVMALYQKA